MVLKALECFKGCIVLFFFLGGVHMYKTLGILFSINIAVYVYVYI